MGPDGQKGNLTVGKVTHTYGGLWLYSVGSIPATAARCFISFFILWGRSVLSVRLRLLFCKNEKSPYPTKGRSLYIIFNYKPKV